MNPHRRWTLGLFAAGVTLLLFSSWLLQHTLPPRDLVPSSPRNGPRKVVRIVPVGRQPLGQDKKRSECGQDPAPLAWMVHDLPFRDAAS